MQVLWVIYWFGVLFFLLASLAIRPPPSAKDLFVCSMLWPYRVVEIIWRNLR